MTRARILVADDEPELQEYFERIVPHLGHELVGVAASGEELVLLAAQLRPDLIVTDIKMDGIDGLEAVARIQRERDVSVIVISGYADRARADAGAAARIDAYLLKPIKKSDLAAAIHSVLRSRT